MLADDNSRFSNDQALRAGFKAHLVFNLALNGRIVFSDNQVICSDNLQKLVAHDPVVHALLEEGFFDLAIRADFNGESGIASLPVVHQAFVDERKIRHAARHYDETPALALIERHARPIPWRYDAIRTNYTSTCERLLLREFRELLGDQDYDWLASAIAAEKERDDGLGRKFLQDRLPDDMAHAGIVLDEARRDLIRRCTEAPYLSNLPSLIGLNPIYADQHRPSFDLMRGARQDVEVTDGRLVPCRFDHAHYVAGLCRLTVDDIRHLQDLPARRTYARLSSGSIRSQSDYDDAYEAFVEFNLLVEDRIASRFPEIARRSSGDDTRTFYKQKAKQYGGAAAEDAAGFLIGRLLVDALPLSLCRQVILDIRDWLRGPQQARTSEAAVLDRVLVQHRLGAHLERSGEAERIGLEDSPGPGPFVKEIIVS